MSGIDYKYCDVCGHASLMRCDPCRAWFCADDYLEHANGCVFTQ